MTNFLAAFHLPGGIEWVVILVIALLIFGKRLPEVGKSIGRTLVEFKKGMKGIEAETAAIDRQLEAAAAADAKPQPRQLS